MSARPDPARVARNAGWRWQRRCAEWLRDHGWPLAMSASRGADMIAGPVAVDSTVISWDKIWAKLDQAGRLAASAGLAYSCVWKKRNGATDPGRGVVMVQADQFFALVRALEAAEAGRVAAERDLDRWIGRERERAG